MPVDFDPILELAIIERECRRRISERIAARQLGEAFKDLEQKDDPVTA